MKSPIKLKKSTYFIIIALLLLVMSWCGSHDISYARRYLPKTNFYKRHFSSKSELLGPVWKWNWGAPQIAFEVHDSGKVYIIEVELNSLRKNSGEAVKLIDSSTKHSSL